MHTKHVFYKSYYIKKSRHNNLYLFEGSCLRLLRTVVSFLKVILFFLDHFQFILNYLLNNKSYSDKKAIFCMFKCLP